MNLATMRAQFRDGVADRASLVSDAVVDLYLNRVHQFELPSDVGSGHRQGEIRFSLQAGKEDYDLDETADVGAANAGLVYQVHEGIAFIDRTDTLRQYSAVEEFYAAHRRDETTQGRPRSVLVLQRTLLFRPLPSAGLAQIAVPADLYRSELTSDGIANAEEAWCVVRGAARDWAIHNGYIAIGRGQEAMYEVHRDRLRGRSVAAKPRFNQTNRVRGIRVRDY